MNAPLNLERNAYIAYLSPSAETTGKNIVAIFRNNKKNTLSLSAETTRKIHCRYLQKQRVKPPGICISIFAFTQKAKLPQHCQILQYDELHRICFFAIFCSPCIIPDICHFFSLTHFESWKFYTRKVRKFTTNGAQSSNFLVFFWNFFTLKKFTLTALPALLTNIRYVQDSDVWHHEHSLGLL